MGIKHSQEPEQLDTEEIKEEPEYHPPKPMRRASRTHQGNTNPMAQNQQTFAPVERTTKTVLTRHHFRVGKPGWFMIAGVLIVLAFWIVWQQIVTPAWNWTQDQWHYGDSRITQMDANVGHGGVSHFVAEYYHGNIVIIEMSLTNPNDFHPYALTGMISETNIPIIMLSVQPGKRDGKPNLVIKVKGSTFKTILYNTGSVFSESEG